MRRSPEFSFILLASLALVWPAAKAIDAGPRTNSDKEALNTAERMWGSPLRAGGLRNRRLSRPAVAPAQEAPVRKADCEDVITGQGKDCHKEVTSADVDWAENIAKNCKSCPLGEYRDGCNGMNLHGNCRPCPTCPANSYRDNCGVATDKGITDGDCLPCAPCPMKDQYRTNCTGASAGVCVNCVACATGEYLAGCGTDEAGINPGSCKPCARCPDGTYTSGCGVDGRPGTCRKCERCDDVPGGVRVGCGGLDEGMCMTNKHHDD